MSGSVRDNVVDGKPSSPHMANRIRLSGLSGSGIAMDKADTHAPLSPASLEQATTTLGDCAMRRRTFLAASAATLALPAIGQAESKRVLKFIPQTDLAVLDPVWTTAYVTRNHGFMVYDTLYGQTGQKDGFKATPQMVAGHMVENDGKNWKLTLREGLMFHYGEKVLARDCVASIKRWGARDAFGQALMARTDETLRAGRQNHRVQA